MNVEKLIEAAKEIRALKEKQDAKTVGLQVLASRARAGENVTRPHPTVVNFGDAIEKLIRALGKP